MRVFGHHVHRCNDVWGSAPPWAIELGYMLALVLKEETIIMSQADDLNNAVTALATGFAALDAAVAQELAEIAEALKEKPNPVITQAIADIGNITGKMATDAAALTASVPAATTVPPPPPAPPEVPVTPTPDIVPDIATPPVTTPNASPPSTPPDSATTNP